MGHAVSREDNRSAFPETAAVVDLYTAAFGPVRVRYTCEGGRELGQRDAPPPTRLPKESRNADQT